VGLFRRRQETLNEKLLREAGLDPAQLLGEPAPPPPDLGPRKSIYAAAGLPDGTAVGPGDWDASTTATAPGLTGDRIRFTTLPDGDLIIEEEQGNGDLSPLADAVEERLQPPYKALATRQDGDLWAVGAKRIEVASFPFRDGDELELSQSDGQAELRVDGEPSDALAPVELERLGQRVGGDYVAQATRIDGDSWEVRVSAL
jgi:hypothetical protein